jgi:hypothetical protein
MGFWAVLQDLRFEFACANGHVSYLERPRQWSLDLVCAMSR